METNKKYLLLVEEQKAQVYESHRCEHSLQIKKPITYCIGKRC